jgi:GTP-binding protein Era
VFSDTPGIINPEYKLQQSMMKFVESAIDDADIFLIITEPSDEIIHGDTVKNVIQSGVPVIFLINKIDLSDETTVKNKIKELKNNYMDAEVIPISALLHFNLDKVLDTIIEKLPEGPSFYPEDELTDKPLRFFIAEMIREKILMLYRKEVPYSVEVKVEEYKEREDIIRIKAYIFVSRESQKMILLGKQGNAIKKLGIESRKDIEDYAGKKVFLELSVKVSKDWRNDPDKLKKFGYEL